MADIDWLIAEAEKSPRGPRVAAFFDFDGTLIDGYSAAVFFAERIKHGDIGRRELFNTLIASLKVERRGHDIDELMRIGVAAYAGRTVSEVQEAANRIFAKRISGMVYPEARMLLEAHQQMGHTIAMASSATLPQLAPAAQDLGISHVLCTGIEVKDGELTGAIDGEIHWGAGKAKAIREFAAERGIDLRQSFAYSNGAEDLPFLESVGRPFALNPDDKLKAIAKERDWPAGQLAMPHRHGPTALVRTVAAYSALGASVGLGAAFAVVNRDRGLGANVAAGVGSQLALAAAGVDLKVVGEANLWKQRPAVFLFNHQSQIDVIVLGALIQRDFSGVAKKELSHDPVFAPIGYLTDIAYIDRANHEKAVEALKPVVDHLKKGRSITIAPEGTRSPTPRLLPFKKGPFHIAIQAQVPVVPVIMRNAGQINPSHSMMISSGTLEVAVLPPVDTSTWTADSVDQHAEDVREMFLAALEHWPATDADLDALTSKPPFTAAPKPARPRKRAPAKKATARKAAAKKPASAAKAAARKPSSAAAGPKKA